MTRNEGRDMMKRILLAILLVFLPLIAGAVDTGNTGNARVDKTEFVKQLMLREKIVKLALSLQGIEYWYGSDDPDYGLDCSGFTQHVYSKAGIKIPRTSEEQFKKAVKLIRPSLQKGDLVFFNTRGMRVNHVGIYIGNDKFIHAPRVGEVIKVDSLDDRYYKMRFQSGGTYILPAK
jgi:cell wall-associated NlpC family hydrolase